MEFLTPGQRIKKIRKQLKMKQNDFIDEAMTRSYFGMIEVGKRNLNYTSAKLIVKKLKEKAAELNEELNIDEEYLLMSEQDEARRYCNEKLKNETSEKDILEVLTITSTYSLKGVEAEAFKALGDLKYNKYEFLEAFINYSNALEACKDYGKVYLQCYLNNRLGMCKFIDLDYVEALLYFSRAQQYSGIYGDLTTELNAIFNLALTYKKLQRIEEAIKYIDLYISKIKDKENYEGNYIDASILKANCFKESGHIEEAIEILKTLIAEFTQIDKKVIANIYNNLGMFYLEKEDFDNSLMAFDESETIRADHDKKVLSHTIIDKSMLYIKKQLYTESVILINMGIDYAVTYNYYYYLLKGYYLLVDIYTIQEKHHEVEKIYIKIKDIVEEKNNNSKELLNIYLKLIQLYINQNNLDKALYYLNLSHKINGKS